MVPDFSVDFVTWYVVVITFFATFLRSTVGFGESLFGVPLLAFVVSLRLAVPLFVLISVFMAVIIVLQDQRQIDKAVVGRLLLFSIPGIPLGLLLLTFKNDQIVQLSLGLLIVIFSIIKIMDIRPPVKDANGATVALPVYGLMAGILGGAYGLSGPPLVMYGSSQNWSATRFRASLQAYFLPTGFLALIGYGYKGLLTPQVWVYFLWSIPVVVPAIFLGRWVNRKLSTDRFYRYVYLALLVLGILFLYSAIT